MKRVLIVDDEDMIRDLLREIVESLSDGGESIEVSECADGLQAHQLLQDQPYDLIISDLNMPKMDGRALIEARKSELPKNGSTPIIILTGQVDAADFGDDPHLQILEKPLEMSKIRATIRDTLKLAH